MDRKDNQDSFEIFEDARRFCRKRLFWGGGMLYIAATIFGVASRDGDSGAGITGFVGVVCLIAGVSFLFDVHERMCVELKQALFEVDRRSDHSGR